MKETTITELSYSKKEWGQEQQSWSTRSEFFVTLHDREDRKQQVVNFLAFINEHNLLPVPANESIRTLDIGCGVGDYALGLSQEGYHAYGIDLATGMVQGAKQIADKEQTSLTLFIGPWSEELRQSQNWDHAFDLVYSIFCPVMLDFDNLAAMTKASKGKCLLLAFADRKDTIVEYLRTIFVPKHDLPMDANTDATIDYIKTIGQNVEATYQVATETESLDIDKAVEYFALRVMDDFDGTKEELYAKLKEALAPFTKESIVTNETEDTILWLSWEPK